jgi:AmpD protein
MDGVRFLASPHHNERPDNMPVDMIVVHAISLPPSEFGTGAIDQFFCGTLDFTQHAYFDSIKDLRVSAHLVINRGGEITQFVPFHQRAWHAGQSIFEGREGCNDFSIGIELEGTEDQPFMPAQYKSLSRVIHALLKTYPKITPERIVGHSTIAPGRKWDPGPHFDWRHLHDLMERESL